MARASCRSRSGVGQHEWLRRPAIQSAVEDKRAAIEILCIKDAMAATGSTMRWVSSDGTTKLSARQGCDGWRLFASDL